MVLINVMTLRDVETLQMSRERKRERERERERDMLVIYVPLARIPMLHRCGDNSRGGKTFFQQFD